MIRLGRPSIDATDLAAVASVLRTGFLVQGRNVELFEERVAAYVGTRRGIAVNSGTSALQLALRSLGVGSGDVVAVPAYSFPASANAVVLCGATPLFVDIDPVTFAMSAGALDAALSSRPAKAVMPVHAFGGMADMRAINSVAEAHGTVVVEDAACAIASELEGRRAGGWGKVACFSFHPRKVITTGEGGIVTTDDEEIAEQVRLLRNHGQEQSAAGIDFVDAGYNLRLTDFQAALGLAQMDKLEGLVAGRRAQADRYRELLDGTDVSAPAELPDSRHTYQAYVVRLPVPRHVRQVIASLRERGVESTIGTYHIPLTSYYRKLGGYRVGDFRNTDLAHDTALSLPLHCELESREQEVVVEHLLEAVKLPVQVPASS